MKHGKHDQEPTSSKTQPAGRKNYLRRGALLAGWEKLGIIKVSEGHDQWERSRDRRKQEETQRETHADDSPYCVWRKTQVTVWFFCGGNQTLDSGNITAFVSLILTCIACVLLSLWCQPILRNRQSAGSWQLIRILTEMWILQCDYKTSVCYLTLSRVTGKITDA